MGQRDRPAIALAPLALRAARQAGLHAQEAPAAAFTSEDFAFMLQARPGAYLWLGQAPQRATALPLHHPGYDFNDDALALGMRWFTAVAQLALAA